MKDLTLETLTARCRYWQGVLRLQDWDVKLEIARLHDLGEGTLGDCSPHTTKRHTKIRVLDPRDVEGQGFWFDGEAWDWEVTLVHELLHLHFHDLFPEGWPGGRHETGKAAERAIDGIAKALVKLERAKPAFIEIPAGVDPCEFARAFNAMEPK